jgi:uncharacterized membrane protein YjjP (DUF1212 family)
MRELQNLLALVWIGAVLYIYAASIVTKLQFGILADLLPALFASLTANYLQ